MALLLHNGQTLSYDDDKVRFGTTGLPVTVGFYQIVGQNIQTTPSLFLCQGKTYAVRVGIPDVETSNPGLYLGPGDENGFTVVPPFDNGGLPSSSGLLSFQILEFGAVIMGRPFEGSLGFSKGQYTFNVTSDYTSVGYPNGLPSLINSCQLCGCPDGSLCGTTGVCRPIAGPCPDNVPCGYQGGRCPGGCPKSGYSCKKINGYYTCVANGYSNFWVVFGVVLFFLLVILLIALFAMKSSRVLTPYTVSKEPTVAIGPF